MKYPICKINTDFVVSFSMAGFLCYYGMVQNTSNMGQGNVYMSYFLGALSEIPCWSVPFIIAKAGRRWTLLALFICSGLCSLSGGAISSALPLIGLTVALVGRMTANGAFFICLQYSSEIFPTVIRGKGVSYIYAIFCMMIKTDNQSNDISRLPSVKLLAASRSSSPR